MSQLLEHILNEDYVSANQIFEEKMLELQEKKLLESKKMIQAEALGGKTRAQAEKEIRARGMTPRKASDVYPDPRDIKLPKMGEPKTDKKRKAPPKSVTPKPKDARPGVFARNWNTLHGRQPGYVEPEKSDSEKQMEKGGRVGKAVRFTGKRIGAGLAAALQAAQPE
jgi:hypothetical protein